MDNNMTFDNLISSVEHVHDITSKYAKGAVNQLLTVRNWMIGYYIVERVQVWMIWQSIINGIMSDLWMI